MVTIFNPALGLAYVADVLREPGFETWSIDSLGCLQTPGSQRAIIVISVVCRCNIPLKSPIRIPMLKRLDMEFSSNGRRVVIRLMTSREIYTGLLLLGGDENLAVMAKKDYAEYRSQNLFADKRGGNGC